MIYLLIFCFSIIPSHTYGKASIDSLTENDFLFLKYDSIRNESGYENLKGELIIPIGRYPMCFTDIFKYYAIVMTADGRMTAIDRNEKILYDVFTFDNGPDYPSEGLFRIIVDGKIGFADYSTGEVIVKPQFDCASQYVEGKAKVSHKCSKILDGEHFTWKSDSWFYIDKSGKKIQSSELE